MKIDCGLLTNDLREAARLARAKPYVCRLPGQPADGLNLRPVSSIKYLRETALPNVEAGLAKTGRKRGDVTFATTAFVIMGNDRDEIERAKAAVRQQIS